MRKDSRGTKSTGIKSMGTKSISISSMGNTEMGTNSVGTGSVGTKLTGKPKENQVNGHLRSADTESMEITLLGTVSMDNTSVGIKRHRVLRQHYRQSWSKALVYLMHLGIYSRLCHLSHSMHMTRIKWSAG